MICMVTVLQQTTSSCPLLLRTSTFTSHVSPFGIAPSMEWNASHLPWTLNQRYVSVYTISEPAVLDFRDAYPFENVDLDL
jgi:hypothetical protein